MASRQLPQRIAATAPVGKLLKRFTAHAPESALDVCPRHYRAELVDLGFAWLGADLGLFVDIRHPIPGRYFTAIRDAAGKVERSATLAGLKAWRAELAAAIATGAAA
jgi:hypothetical protein